MGAITVVVDIRCDFVGGYLATDKPCPCGKILGVGATTEVTGIDLV